MTDLWCSCGGPLVTEVIDGQAFNIRLGCHVSTTTETRPQILEAVKKFRDFVAERSLDGSGA